MIFTATALCMTLAMIAATLISLHANKSKDVSARVQSQNPYR